MSKPALCATRIPEDIRGSISSHTSGKQGASKTVSSLMPVSMLLKRSKGCSGSTRE